MRNTGPSPFAVQLVLDRAGYSCEVCDHMVGDRRGVDWSIHHRRPRKMGGTRWPGINLPSNLIAVHGASNVAACHGRIHRNTHRESVDNGWLITRNGINRDPLQIPVLIGSRRVYLTDDGLYAEAPAVVA